MAPGDIFSLRLQKRHFHSFRFVIPAPSLRLSGMFGPSDLFCSQQVATLNLWQLGFDSVFVYTCRLLDGTLENSVD